MNYSHPLIMGVLFLLPEKFIILTWFLRMFFRNFKLFLGSANKIFKEVRNSIGKEKEWQGSKMCFKELKLNICLMMSNIQSLWKQFINALLKGDVKIDGAPAPFEL